MIYKISAYFFLPMLLLALFLSLAGVQQIQFGDSYYSFMRSVTGSFNAWKFEIPSIPKINYIDQSDYEKSGLILDILIKIGNFFVAIVNGLVGCLNITITVANILIQVVQFILTIIYQCKDFITKVSPAVA